MMKDFLIVICMLVGMFTYCNATLNLHILTEGVERGARCLDGSPPAFYFRAASNPKNADKWVLFIQGGGWCYKDESCLERSLTHLGSSKKMNKTMVLHGMLSDSESENPEFYSWNHVVFAYCDGASFTGSRIDPVHVKGKTIYYRGFYNLKGIIHTLLTEFGMNKATEVILAGGSAGGAATYIHADQIASMLPKTVKRYKAVPFSGMFLNHANVENKMVYNAQLKHVFEMQNSTYGVDTHCLVGKTEENRHFCMFGQETIKHSITPFFVFNSMYDAWSLSCILTTEPVRASSSANYNCSAAPGWKKCVMNETCTAEQWKELNTKWGDDYRTMLETNRGLKTRGNGLFAYSCHFHDAEIKGHHWNGIKINGVSMREAFVNWYYSNNEEASKHTRIDCKINGNFHCNPTCSA